MLNKYKEEVAPEMCEKGESELHAGVEKQVDEIGQANLEQMLVLHSLSSAPT